MTTATPSRHKAHIRYRLADGSLVPGVTTVLSVLAKPALVPWANRLGLDGIDVAKHVDELAQAGTLTHAMVLADLTDGELDTDGYTKHEIELAENAFLSYLEWKKGHVLEPFAVETPMVSETWEYGGTPDFFGLLDGKASGLDFKTSKDIYPEHLHQVAAYWMLIETSTLPLRETNRLPGPVEAGGVIQVGRTEDEGFGTKFMAGPGLHWDIFRYALEIYRLQRQLGGSHRWRKREESNGDSTG